MVHFSFGLYLWRGKAAKANKKPALSAWKAQGQFIQTVVPLCFTLSSQRAPYQVTNITLAK
jgi:hypothetical protein